MPTEVSSVLLSGSWVVTLGCDIAVVDGTGEGLLSDRRSGVAVWGSDSSIVGVAGKVTVGSGV
jgi:hypothetical protein